MTTTIRRTIAALWVFALVCLPVAALAQTPGGQQQTEFVPVSQLPAAEQMPAAPLVIAAYAFVWIAVTFYLWSIWRRIGRVEDDMQALRRRTSERGASR